MDLRHLRRWGEQRSNIFALPPLAPLAYYRRHFSEFLRKELFEYVE
jgi:hypothetical protein